MRGTFDVLPYATCFWLVMYCTRRLEKHT